MYSVKRAVLAGKRHILPFLYFLSLFKSKYYKVDFYDNIFAVATIWLKGSFLNILPNKPAKWNKISIFEYLLQLIYIRLLPFPCDKTKLK